MKAAWIRPGGPLFPDQEKARRVGLEQFFWDATDPGIDPDRNGGIDVLAAMRKAGWKVGTTRDPQWTNSSDPKNFAALLSADINKFAGPGIQHSVIADMEMHDPSNLFVLPALKEFRRLRPGRFIYWTLEPLQGGWFSKELIDWISLDTQTWAVPQCYRGSMAPVSERAVVNDLVFAGILGAKVLAYYDRLEEGFNGVIFDWASVRA